MRSLPPQTTQRSFLRLGKSQALTRRAMERPRPGKASFGFTASALLGKCFPSLSGWASQLSVRGSCGAGP